MRQETTDVQAYFSDTSPRDIAPADHANVASEQAETPYVHVFQPHHTFGLISSVEEKGTMPQRSSLCSTGVP